jgi:beta-hydroxyacyl-ACP dehydratase FabZ
MRSLFFFHFAFYIFSFCILMTVYDASAIQEIIPHRYPFLLVDRIIELVPGTRIVGIKQVTINEPFFQGHFPGAPVMPGVLIVEAMAQVGAVYALSQIEDRNTKLVLFSGIDNARFRRPVTPGDTLTIEVTPVRVGSRVQRMRGLAKVDGQLAAEADIMSVITDRSATSK